MVCITHMDATCCIMFQISQRLTPPAVLYYYWLLLHPPSLEYSPSFLNNSRITFWFWPRHQNEFVAPVLSSKLSSSHPPISLLNPISPPPYHPPLLSPKIFLPKCLSLRSKDWALCLQWWRSKKTSLPHCKWQWTRPSSTCNLNVNEKRLWQLRWSRKSSAQVVLMTFHIMQGRGCLQTNRKRSDLFTN